MEAVAGLLAVVVVQAGRSETAAGSLCATVVVVAAALVAAVAAEMMAAAEDSVVGAALGGGDVGGDGGFGGGGGDGRDEAGGVGGFLGGDASTSGGGGGGAGFGGAIFNMFGSVTLVNSTLYGNSAHGGAGGDATAAGGGAYGGGIFNVDGTVSLTNCTLANNTVTAGANATVGYGGGAVFSLAFGNKLSGGAQTATVTSANSIFVGSGGAYFDVQLDEVDGASTNTSTMKGTGPNISQTAPYVAFGTTLTGTKFTVTDPKLDPAGPKNNGGPTKTIALLSGSPAIGKANVSLAPATDQRGISRGPTPDLGAFQTPFVDNFTRANSSNLGSNWTTDLGTMGISGNKAAGLTTPGLPYVVDLAQVNKLSLTNAADSALVNVGTTGERYAGVFARRDAAGRHVRRHAGSQQFRQPGRHTHRGAALPFHPKAGGYTKRRLELPGLPALAHAAQHRQRQPGAGCHGHGIWQPPCTCT